MRLDQNNNTQINGPCSSALLRLNVVFHWHLWLECVYLERGCTVCWGRCSVEVRPLTHPVTFTQRSAHCEGALGGLRSNGSWLVWSMCCTWDVWLEPPQAYMCQWTPLSPTNQPPHPTHVSYHGRDIPDVAQHSTKKDLYQTRSDKTHWGNLPGCVCLCAGCSMIKVIALSAQICTEQLIPMEANYGLCTNCYTRGGKVPGKAVQPNDKLLEFDNKLSFDFQLNMSLKWILVGYRGVLRWCFSVGQPLGSTTVCRLQSDIGLDWNTSQQFWLLWNFVQTFIVPRGWTLTFHLAPPASQQPFTYPVKYLNIQLMIGTNHYRDIHNSKRMYPKNSGDFANAFSKFYWLSNNVRTSPLQPTIINQ